MPTTPATKNAVTAAIAGLETTPPDALILDLQLPSGSGLQVLRAVREMAGKTQAEVATAMKMGQGHVSMFETRDDRRVSNLRRYIKALGGELKMVARFGKKEVRLDV